MIEKLFNQLGYIKKPAAIATKYEPKFIGFTVYFKDGTTHRTEYDIQSEEEFKKEDAAINEKITAATKTIDETSEDRLVNVLGVSFRKSDFVRIAIFRYPQKQK